MKSLRSVAVPFAVMVLALLGVPAVAVANPCFFPGNCSGDTQVLAVTGSGGLFHTFRIYDGRWLPVGDVEHQTGDPGRVTDTSAAINYGEPHVVAVTDFGGLFHTIRYPQGAWIPMGNVKQMTGDPGQVTRVGLSG